MQVREDFIEFLYIEVPRMFILTSTLCVALKLEHFNMGKNKNGTEWRVSFAGFGVSLLRFIALRMFSFNLWV